MASATTEQHATAMHKTPLYEEHQRLGAKLVDFHGYWMPVSYAGIIEEHLAVRRAVGLLDLSHMGEVEFTGPDALGAIQQLVTNDVAKLQDHQALYSPMCRQDGGILDDLIIYRRAADCFFIVINCSNIAKDVTWMRKQAGLPAALHGSLPDAAQAGKGRVTFRDISHDTSLLALQGPKAAAVVTRIFGQDHAALPRYGFADTTFEGDRWMVARTSYTGDDGFELFGPNATAASLWRRCLEVGRSAGIRPVGLGARDTLRLEAALVLYGNEIDETRTPWEANLGWSVALTKKAFLGREALAAKRTQVTDKLIGFVMEERAIPRTGCLLRNGKATGGVTSGSFCPTLQQAVGLGYLPKAAAAPGTAIEVIIRDRPYRATVVTTPFLKRGQVIQQQRRNKAS